MSDPAAHVAWLVDRARISDLIVEGVHLPGPGSSSGLRRTEAGRRFTRVRITEVWHAGEPLEHV